MEESYKANKYLVSTSITLVLFGILNIGKNVFPAFKAILNFYPPVGPLLGLYLTCIIIFLLLLGLFTIIKVKSQTLALWLFIVGIITFFLLVFPPVYEPIVHIFTG